METSGSNPHDLVYRVEERRRLLLSRKCFLPLTLLSSQMQLWLANMELRERQYLRAPQCH